MTVSQNLKKYRKLFANLPKQLQKEYQKEVYAELTKNINYLIQNYYAQIHMYPDINVLPYEQIYRIQLKNSTFHILFTDGSVNGHSFPSALISGAGSPEIDNLSLYAVLKSYIDGKHHPNSFMECYKRALRTTTLNCPQRIRQ